jgi:hypothetical protein
MATSKQGSRSNSASSAGSAGGEKKPSRIEKELMLLRNLPHSYKLGRKTTSLGIVIYVSKRYNNKYSWKSTKPQSVG